MVSSRRSARRSPRVAAALLALLATAAAADEAPLRSAHELLGPEPPPPSTARPEDLRDNQAALSAGRARVNDRDQTVRAEGGVVAYWRDLTVSGTSVWWDRRAGLARFEGPVRAWRRDGSWSTTDWLELDTSKYWSHTGPFEGQLTPEFIGNGVTEPLNLRGSDSLNRRDYYFAAHQVLLSSCPPTDLKYQLTARTIAVIPNRKIILRSPKLFLFGIPVFGMGKVVIPLRQYRRTSWWPEVGRNDIYGFFARMRYFYDLADSQLGNLSGMVTEKRGMFYGLEHDFGYGRGDWRGVGSLDLEYGTRNAELSVRGSLDQGMGPDTRFRLNGSLSENSGFSTTSRQANLTGQLTHQFAFGNTALSFNRSQSQTAAQRSVFSRYNLAQRFQVGQQFSADLSADYSVRELSGTASDEELNTRARLQGRWTLFDWELVDERRFDVEGSAFPNDDNRPVTEIVPQLTLKTDTRRLGIGLGDLLDLSLNTSVGQLREFVAHADQSPDTKSTVLRVNFDLDGQLRRFALSRSSRFLGSFRYSQSFFDHPNPAAKYIVAFGPRLEWKPSRRTRLDLDYRWQEVSGFSPLRRYDFAQTINDLDYTYNWFVPDPARPRSGYASLRLSGGYDFLTGRARDLRIGLRVSPIDEVLIDVNTSYALDGRGVGDAGLRTVRGQMLFWTGPRYQHEIGFTYDARNGRLDTIDSLLTWEPLHHFILQQALTYDGNRERISFHDLLATLDLGCVQLVGTYRQQAQEYRLDLNITAFPGIGSLFGTGRFGQQFSTSQGFSF